MSDTSSRMYRSAGVGPLLDVIRSRGAVRPLAVLVRHSTREEIVGLTVSDAMMAPLTEAGRRLAWGFGKGLPPDRAVRIFSSEVPRCLDTAAEIARGFREAGGDPGEVTPRRSLAASFIRDAEVVAREFGTRGARGFVQAWAAGELGPSVLAPLAQAARDQLANLLEAIPAHPPEATEGAGLPLHLHVSHDVNVVALLHLMLDVTDPQTPWPGYLEGVVVEGQGDPPYVAWYGEQIGQMRP